MSKKIKTFADLTNEEMIANARANAADLEGFRKRIWDYLNSDAGESFRKTIEELGKM